MDENLEKWVRNFLKSKEESIFSRFIICEMGFSGEDDKKTDEEIRRDAFLEFGKRTGHKKFAVTQTMKRWFGLEGFSCPSRETLFEICFALKLTVAETERYLMQGIFEPTFQVNDYAEVFYFYGLENGKSYEEISEMISAYEEILAEHFFKDGRMAEGSFSTKELKKELYLVKRCSKENFMLWMRDHARVFKGYSQTTQTYLEKLRERIYENSISDLRSTLEARLAEIGYPGWAVKHAENYKTTGDAVRVYLKILKKRKKQSLSDMEYKNLLELVRLVYVPKETNVKMYELLFTPKTKALPYLSEKQLSDLFRVPMRKIFLKNLKMAEIRLKKLPEKEECPEEILLLLLKTDQEKQKMEKYSVGEALEQIVQYEKKEKSRTFLLHREELLPILYYVVWEEYDKDKMLQKKMSAREYFCDYGNSVLSACGLEGINEKFKLDALLLACMENREECDYQDILYAVGRVEKEMEEEG